MNPPQPRAPWIEREAYIDAFEEAYLANPSADLGQFLPPPGNPLRAGVLEELVRIDLEHHWAWGLPRWLEEYRARFPELFDDPEVLTSLAKEEYRLRTNAGQKPVAGEYDVRFGIDLDPVVEDEQLDGPRSTTANGSQFAAVLAAMPQVGENYLDYRLCAVLGVGSCGRVYLAERDGEQFALKIGPDLGNDAAILTRLRHPNVVPVVGVHQVETLQTLAMPYLGATTLAQVLRHIAFRGDLPASGAAFLTALRTEFPVSASVPRERRQSVRQMLVGMTYVEAVLWIGARIAAGLSHAHTRGVLHGDLKPANVLLADDGRPVLLDFNFADTDGSHPGGGTLPYMAPEILDGLLGRPQAVDGRSDLYALGVILFQLLTARLPFPPPRDASPPGISRTLQERFAPPDLRGYRSEVPVGVAAIVRRLLEPDPTRRYPTARQVQKELTRCLRESTALRASPRDVTNRRTRRSVVAPIVLVAAAAAAWAVMFQILSH